MGVWFNIERKIGKRVVEETFSSTGHANPTTIIIKRHYIPLVKNPYKVEVVEDRNGHVTNWQFDVLRNYRDLEEFIRHGYKTFIIGDDSYRWAIRFWQLDKEKLMYEIRA